MSNVFLCGLAIGITIGMFIVRIYLKIKYDEEIKQISYEAAVYKMYYELEIRRNDNKKF